MAVESDANPIARRTMEPASGAIGALLLWELAAVEEQLGLRLEKQKAPQEMTIIDHAELPTDN